MIFSGWKQDVVFTCLTLLFCSSSLGAQKSIHQLPSETLHGPVYGHATLVRRSQARPSKYRAVAETDIEELQKARSYALKNHTGRREGIRVFHIERTLPVRPKSLPPPPSRAYQTGMSPLLLASNSKPVIKPKAPPGPPDDPLNVGQAFSADSGGVEPPDPILAVGTHFIVQIDNGNVTFFPRIVHGNPPQLAAPQMPLGGPGGLFATTRSSFFDPWIVFDPTTQRWFASIVQDDTDSNGNITASDILLAVTSSEDPTNATSWVTHIVSSATYLQDQPKLAVGADKILMTWENVSQNNAQIEIIDKNDVVNGLPSPGVASYNDGVGILDCLKGLVPARMLSVSTNTMFALSTKTWCGDSVIRVYTVTGTPDGKNVNVQSNSVTLKSSFTVPQDPTDPFTSQRVDAGDARLLSAVWQNNELFATGADGCIPPTDSVPRSCVRIYEVSVSGAQPSLVDDFDIVGDLTPDYVFHPALDVDQSGDIIGTFEESPAGFLNVLAFAIPAGSEQPVLSNGDFLGNLGTGTYPLGCFDSAFNAERTGDYSGAAMDPLYPNVVWLTGELSGGAGTAGINGVCSWNTVIGSFTIGSQRPSISSLSFSANGNGAVISVTGSGFASWPDGATADGWCTSLGPSPALELQDITQGVFAGQPGDSSATEFALWQTSSATNAIEVCGSPPSALKSGDQVTVTVASNDGLLTTATGTVPNFAAITLAPPPPSSIIINQSFTLYGQVQNKQGFIATQAPVSLSFSPAQPIQNTNTDVNGAFMFQVTAPLMNGPLNLTFSAPDATKNVVIQVIPYTTVTGISPDHGLACSQTYVEITGVNFAPGQTQILFGTAGAQFVGVLGVNGLIAESPVSNLPGATSCPNGSVVGGVGSVTVLATLLNTASVGGPDFYYYDANSPLLINPGVTSDCLKAKVQAHVWDATGKPVVNGQASVTFSATPATTTTFSGTTGPGQSVTVGTDDAGIATAWLTSTQDGTVLITATTAAGTDTISTDFVQPNLCKGGNIIALPSDGLVWLPVGPGPLSFGVLNNESGWRVNPGPEVPDFYRGTSFVEMGNLDANVLGNVVHGYIASKQETRAFFNRYPDVSVPSQDLNARYTATFVAPVVIFSDNQMLQRQHVSGKRAPQSHKFRVTLPYERKVVEPGAETLVVWLDTSSGVSHWTTAGLSQAKMEDGLVSVTTSHIGIFSAVRIVPVINENIQR